MKSTEKRPSLLLSDAGPDSHDSNKLVLEYGIIPVIAARSNSVGDIIKTDEGDCFRGEYIPREYHRILGRFMTSEQLSSVRIQMKSLDITDLKCQLEE